MSKATETPSNSTELASVQIYVKMRNVPTVDGQHEQGVLDDPFDGMMAVGTMLSHDEASVTDLCSSVLFS